MLCIAATREGIRDKVISDTEFGRSSNNNSNILDGVNKSMSQAIVR